MDEIGYAQASRQGMHGALSGAVSSKGEPATIAGAIVVVDGVHESLVDAAQLAERIADQMGGSVPSSAGDNKPASSPNCIVEHLSDRVVALRSPAARIHDALRRIERRVG